MRTLLDKEDELASQINGVEVRIALKIAEINALLNEMVDYPTTEKEMNDFDDQIKIDIEQLEAEMRVLMGQRTVISRRIYEYEMARRSFLGLPQLPELPKPQ